MTVRLRFFAALRERIGRSELEVALADGARVADAWAMICQQHPQVEMMGGAMSFALNHEYVERDHLLAHGDELALIPPVSGGL